MKVMVFIKATMDSEAGVMPSPQLIASMGEYIQALLQAGIMKDGGGLKPSKHARRVRFSGTDRTVSEGPFTFTDEIVSGYWIWEVQSMDEAVEWIKKCPNPMLTDSDVDIRPLYTPEDFA